MKFNLALIGAMAFGGAVAALGKDTANYITALNAADQAKSARPPYDIRLTLAHAAMGAVAGATAALGLTPQN